MKQTKTDFCCCMLDKLRDVEGRNILVLGCGEGELARELARRGALVTAVDIDEDALVRSAKLCMAEELPVCHFIRDSNHLDGFVDDSSDIVLCSAQLTDRGDPEGTLREAARVLKPGGRMYACAPQQGPSQAAYAELLLRAGLVVLERALQFWELTK